MELWDLFDEYELAARSTNRSQNTITSMRYHVRRFALFLDRQQHSLSCDAVTPRVLREYIASLNETHAATTVTNNVIALKTLFAFGVREELIANDPSKRVAVPRLPKVDYEIFDNDDIDRLLQACDRSTLTGVRDFAIVMLLFDTGIRASELIGIRDVDIDWQRGLVRVRGKGSKERLVPVSARTLRAIKRYVNKRNGTIPTESRTVPDNGTTRDAYEFARPSSQVQAFLCSQRTAE
jgi:site-specific recombinase XerD